MSLLLLGSGTPGLTDLELFEDTFATDRLAEYTLTHPSAYVVAGGVLTANPPGAVTTGVVTAHSVQRAAVTVRYAAPASGFGGVIQAYLSAGNYLFARRDGNAIIGTRIANTPNTLASAGWTFAADDYARFTRDGNQLTLERWTTDPALGGSPANSLSHTLTGADAVLFGAGVAGRMGVGNQLGFEVGYDMLRIEALAP